MKSTKGKGPVKYDIIIQVVVNLSPVTCTVKKVSQLVAKQVDFDVILLESKGFLLLMKASLVNLSGNQLGKVWLQTKSSIR